MDSWAGETSTLYGQYVHKQSSFYNFCAIALLDTLDLKPGVRVLDLAGGGGIASRMILQREPQANITILDVSAEQLSHAKDVFGDKVQYVQASAEHYAPSEQFDIVVCANAFWYLHPSVIPKIASWLADGGVFAFNLHEKCSYFKETGLFSKIAGEIDKLCRERHRTACIMYSPSVNTDQLESQLSSAGFSVAKTQADYEEPKENWHTLCELQARRTAPYMAISVDGEAKLALFRQAFRNVTKQEGKVERHTLLFVCKKN
jgi:trans-aconitate methyltransferase